MPNLAMTHGFLQAVQKRAGWTWPASDGDSRTKQRFDRIFLKGKKAGRRSASSLALKDVSFRLLRGGLSDHFGVACTVTLAEAREKQLRRRQRCSGEPLRMGARARVFQCVALSELLC